AAFLLFRSCGALHHARNLTAVVRIDEEVAELWIEAAPAPIEAAIRSWKHNRVGHAHGSERAVVLRVFKKFIAILSMLRREARDFILFPSHSRERWRLKWKRLCGRIPLAGHIALRDRALFHAVDRLAVAPVEDEDQSSLACLD